VSPVPTLFPVPLGPLAPFSLCPSVLGYFQKTGSLEQNVIFYAKQLKVDQKIYKQKKFHDVKKE